MDQLEHLFPGQALGGLARIVGTLDGDVVRQQTALTSLRIGGLNAKAVLAEVAETLDVPSVDFSVVDDVMGAVGEVVFHRCRGTRQLPVPGAGVTVLDAGEEPRILGAISETEAVAAAAGYPVSDAGSAQAVGISTASDRPSLRRWAGTLGRAPSEAELH